MSHDAMDHGAHGAAPPAGRPTISNMPHQHALVLVGEDTVFGVHMTQYHHEEHKYQMILRLALPHAAAETLAAHRRTHPLDTFILCNDAADELTIPEIASGRTARFRANIFQGLPPFTQEDEERPHFFPWSLDRVEPIAGDFEVTVERVVLFRPFAHHLVLPDFATYYLFGRGAEAHMTHLQTARLATGPFEVPAFGPDYDHVLSLASAPDWIAPDLLEAGIVVSAPAVRMRDPSTGAPKLPCKDPFQRGAALELLYRGMGPLLGVVAGNTFLFGAGVCTSPSLMTCPEEDALVISPTPPNQLRQR
jgi:hypothetical protein